MRSVHFLAAAACALGVIACGGGEEETRGTDFGIYVPNATPVIPAATGSVDTRHALGVVSHEVLELGAGVAGNPEQFKLAVGQADVIYALDIIDGGIRKADASGNLIAWESVGEAALSVSPPPIAVSTSGDRIVTASFPPRVQVRDGSGALISDTELDAVPWRLNLLDDETYVAFVFPTGVVGRFSMQGDELARYTVFEFPSEDDDLRGDRRLWPQQMFAAGRSRVYVTTSEEHTVSAYEMDGANVWVLQGQTELVPIPDHISGRTLGRSRRAGRAAGATIDTEYANARWPDFYPALAGIATDAADRLYVFPFVIEENAERYPVDVYSKDGELLVRGWLPFQSWDAFSDSAVYRIEPRDGTNVVVRYELTLPISGVVAAQ